MECRFARREDLPGILKLYEQLNPQDRPLTPEAASAIWADIERLPNIKYAVALESGTIAATCNVTIIPNLTRGGRPFAIVENVVTDAAFRKRGLGKAVIDLVSQYATGQGCYKIMLLSNAKRLEAHQFYKSLGFNSEAKKGFVKDLEDH
jgi:GNAT superfamily N-acetyltransferase